MLNRALLDLEDVSIRAKYFNGRSADDIAAEMPLMPVNAPGIPSPGHTLLLHAHNLGDGLAEEPAGKGKSKRITRDKPNGKYLTSFVRNALYNFGMTLNLEFGGSTDEYRLVPGITKIGDNTYYGPQQSRLTVIGKCVGWAEIASAQPYCGPGSAPLWSAWKESGLPPAGSPQLATYLTNLIKFSPNPAALTRLPSDWVRDGVHLLYHELIITRPEFILILGADALKALFGAKAKIDDYRGRLAELTIDARSDKDDVEDKFTCKVVVADHPAAVARDADKYPALVSSLRYLAQEMGFVDSPQAIPLDHKAIHTVDELRKAVLESIDASRNGGYIAFDCEWDGRNSNDKGAYLYTVQWSHAPGHARVAYLRTCGGAKNNTLPLAKAAPMLSKLIADAPKRGARLVGHFAKADLPWLESIGVNAYDAYVGPMSDPDPDGVNTFYDWQKCYVEGAFDTYVAAHAVEETSQRGLEYLAATILNMPRYDVPVAEWVAAYCRTNKLKRSELSGYGNIPEEIMTPYACYDADVAGRLYLYYNGNPHKGTRGALDKDRFGLSSRQIFAIRMRAWAAIAEMERYGMLVDRVTHKEQREHLLNRREELLMILREEAAWPGFNPARRAHRVEFLFGELNAIYNEPPDGYQSDKPAGAMSLYLEPFKSTAASGGRLWKDAMNRYRHEGGVKPVPAADKETLTVLSRQHQLAKLLLDIDFLSTALKILFRPPDEPATDDDEEHYDRGFMSCVSDDDRVRSRFGLVESGRLSSSGPNMQNCGASVDERYDTILEWGKAAKAGTPNKSKSFASRAIIKSQPGWFLVGADLKGAEIYAAAIQSGDAKLIKDASRNTLPEDHPDYLDLHSDLAASAFNLRVASLLEVKANYKALRVAAKRTRFSHYYGASPDTILRQVQLDNPEITLEQIHQLVRGHDKMYPELTKYFALSRSRGEHGGYIRNGFGGTRRFRKAASNDMVAAQGREAQNWTCQGLVADAISMALGNLWYEIRLRKMQTRIVLSVHDSIMVECPANELITVVDDLLPTTMCDQVPIVVTTLDGVPLPRGPYYFDIDIGVYRNWGVELEEKLWRVVAATAQLAS